ncbi:FAD-dependent oxidoreductase [Stieleria sp. TO1_6]|uniref:FAD-dependent oxidoreductase n=1 Tax=Stieleria tagensis TaxID=2956795 RepID=UPI00209BA5E6|nr:FAD-dependent oxidoreductase [Stieleria tagensis]MCO8125344.1 FAD-dependent oxidoreductase [Stieleria tagensis]
MPPRQIVLLGIGHTNAHVVKQWETHPIPGCSLICISKFATATYSGMLPGTLGRQFKDDEMRIDLARLSERAGAKLILADTIGLDRESGTLHFSDRDSVRFDALSIGVGSIPAGLQDHAGAESLVAIKPMQTFLQRLDQRMATIASSDSQRRKVVIVGGGVAGVEIAFCLHQQFQQRNLSDDFSIQIFTSGRSIAEGMSATSIGKLERLLRSRDVQVSTQQRVTGVFQDHLVTADDRRHAADCVIWATGAAPPAVLGCLGLETDARGFIATNDQLQSLSDSRIFAVGDSGTVVKSPAPKAGLYAVRQSPILWHNLQALMTGGDMKVFRPQSDFLKLLNTGDEKAFLQYGPIATHARWCWLLKTWIDKRFVAEFKNNS